jgi:cell division protein FtsI (penicillin-binding protein 3)
VVSQGLAKPAGSKQFAVAGKTGTAQISQGAAGYTAGGRKYLVSFCGYFPADAPKYSLIVSIQKPGLPASGGQMAGSVFSKIAERVFAKNLSYELKNAIDSTSVVIPDVKPGNLAEASYILGKLDVPTEGKTSKDVWGKAEEDSTSVTLTQQTLTAGTMPSVIGMGAKDAVYLLEKAGLRVNIAGVGKVTRQSIPSGNKYSKGQTVALQLH